MSESVSVEPLKRKSLEEIAPASKKVNQNNPKDKSRNCPYLDTINRNVLDFDFEKLCSVSISRINVYACLVCGKYFQGRGPNTHAYMHSVQAGHHVFLNLQTLRFYCIPDNYEIIDSSLDDITYVLKPTFTKEEIAALDQNDKLSRAYNGMTYMPGIVGLNNIKANDYCNVILQALSHVPPLRNFFLREENYMSIKRPPGDTLFLLVQRFGELLRKLWNPRNFKAHVSPHEMLQAVVLCSKKMFQITEQGDPIAFLSWFLNSLHSALNGTKKPNSSIVYKTFQGALRIYTRTLLPIDATEEEKQQLLMNEEYQGNLPWSDDSSTLARNAVLRLRFTKNTFFIEKNNTIVNFPIKNVDFSEIFQPEAHEKQAIYDLIANIVHDGEPGSGKGTYRTHILHRDTEPHSYAINGTQEILNYPLKFRFGETHKTMDLVKPFQQ
ncbi:U4/U6.U5 tri-snRNP-associated protein 2 like protein [Argiope bruennichi]|uniref:ubiquitinyl hydrolase 1 n=1 Tax=Argiope bruennichi TaxID=94029 RepID=A0A8T0E3C8_ARGBR|nr:U4/U6.U5 tri-snRNP-associated protein 2 like protein [Argiope bruennichi]